MHDRRIQGRARIFGNQGWLYMRAMTWWDHETGSIWTQPTGTALIGLLRGTRLRPLPAILVPWQTWRAEHPSTQVLADQGFAIFRERPRDDFVIGVALGEHAVGFYYRDAVRARVINAAVGLHPLLIVADPATRRVQTFLRKTGDRVLTFSRREGHLVDQETGTKWDPIRGIGTAGPLRGAVLRIIPHLSSFDWAWRDHYPHATFYDPSR